MDYSSILSKPKTYFRKEKVWMAQGDDLALFNRHRSNIQNLLRHSGIPESNHRLWIGLYRIGTNQDEAKTLVVVSCSDQSIRRLTRDVLSSCPMFQQGGDLAQFKITSKATPPETACEPQLTMQDDSQSDGLEAAFHSVSSLSKEGSYQDAEAHDEQRGTDQRILRLYRSNTGDNYLCRRVQALQRSHEGVLQSQSATAGPLIWLDGHSYQLTVEHVVDFDDQKNSEAFEHTDENYHDGDDWDDDGDDDNTSGCSLDENVASWNIPERRNMSSASSYSENSVDLSGSLSSNSIREVAPEDYAMDTTTNEAIANTKTYTDNNSSAQSKAESGSIHSLTVQDSSSSLQTSTANSPTLCRASPEVDYLLIPTSISPEERSYTPDSAEIVQLSDVFNMCEQTEARRIIIATESLGYVHGTVFPASTLLRRPRSKSFQTFFCIESDEAMPKGTSGSAVFDVRTGILAGYIVLGCPGKNIWYMAPIAHVLEDLETTFGSTARCQIQLNVSATVRTSNTAQPCSTTGSLSQFRSNTSDKCISGPQPKIDPDHGESRGGRKTLRSLTSKSSRRFGDYFLRAITSAVWGCIDWCRIDDWHRRYDPQLKVPTRPEHDRPFLDIIKEHEPELLEVPMFMSSHSGSLGWERRITSVERFCEGASSPSETPMPDKAGTEHLLQPQAWVFDSSDAHERLFPHSSKAKVLNKYEFYEALQKKRLSGGDRDNTAQLRRQIYISNPDAFSILALMRTTPVSQVSGLRELLSNYITENPRPSIGLKESFWSGDSSFIFSFNLPFFAIKNHGQFNPKTAVNANRVLRRRYGLSFLDIEDQESGIDASKNPAFQHDGTFLYETTCSTIVTGRSERYWTAFCLNDDLPNEQESVEDAARSPIEPTTSKDREKVIDNIVSPRAYALNALATVLERIVEDHAQIQEDFGASLNQYTKNARHSCASEGTRQDHREWRRKFPDVLGQVIFATSRMIEQIDKFLASDVMTSPEGLPCSPLWTSIQTDPSAIESLRRIKESFNDLCEIKTDLLQLLGSLNALRGERLNFHCEAVEVCDRQNEEITIAAFGIGILTLIAQIYSLRPEKGDLPASPGYLVFIMLFIFICVSGIVFIFRQSILFYIWGPVRWLRNLQFSVESGSQVMQDLRRGVTIGCVILDARLRYGYSQLWQIIGLLELLWLSEWLITFLRTYWLGSKGVY